MSSTNMTRMVLMPPNVPAESIAVLRKAFELLAKDQDFLRAAIATMRFQPRFEVGEAGERFFRHASAASPEVVNFLRKYIDEANR